MIPSAEFLLLVMRFYVPAEGGRQHRVGSRINGRLMRRKDILLLYRLRTGRRSSVRFSTFDEFLTYYDLPENG